MQLLGALRGCVRELARALPPVMASFRPDLVMYDAGVDPHKDDSLGKLALTDQGLLRRDLQARCACYAHSCL